MKDIFSFCQACCESMSSLLIRYSADRGLKPSTMQPQMEVRCLQSAVREVLGEGEDQVDAAGSSRFEFASAFYNLKWPEIQLNENLLAYLDTVASKKDGPLLQLKQKGVLTEKVLDASLCLMMYSLASKELVGNRASMSNPNHSITAFLHCALAIDRVHPVEFKKSIFSLSLLFYCEVLKENNVNISNLQSILQELIDIDTPQQPLTIEGSQPSIENGTDFTDSPLVSTCTFNLRLPSLCALS